MAVRRRQNGDNEELDDLVGQAIDKELGNGHGKKSGPQQELALPEPPPWPKPLAPEAYFGLAGEITQLIEPQTEADPAAILIQILAMYGSAIGRGSHWKVEDTTHYGNLFCCLVGDTATARKGTSKGRAMRAFNALDPADGWKKRVVSGLSTGEGLISAVQDPTYKIHHVKEKGRVVDTQNVIDSPGVDDKRLLVVESEFGRTLRAMQREGNTLSAILRMAWDGDDLASLTKGPECSRLRATNPYISLIAHVTPAELKKLLTDVETANGLANRFLWIACKYSKLLPLGGERLELGDQERKIADAVNYGKTHQEIPFNELASKVWEDEIYKRLFHRPPGLLGAVTNRAVAQVRRLAILYASLACSNVVTRPHLFAALAVWNFCEQSARWVFGDSTGNTLADEILAELRAVGQKGLAQTEISSLFGRHKSAGEIAKALAVLEQSHQARKDSILTSGRPKTTWYENSVCEKSEKSEKSNGETT